MCFGHFKKNDNWMNHHLREFGIVTGVVCVLALIRLMGTMCMGRVKAGRSRRYRQRDQSIDSISSNTVSQLSQSRRTKETSVRTKKSSVRKEQYFGTKFGSKTYVL